MGDVSASIVDVPASLIVVIVEVLLVEMCLQLFGRVAEIYQSYLVVTTCPGCLIFSALFPAVHISSNVSISRHLVQASASRTATWRATLLERFKYDDACARTTRLTQHLKMLPGVN